MTTPFSLIGLYLIRPYYGDWIQGKIIARVADTEYYVVQLFDWVMGYPSKLVLLAVADLSFTSNCAFYSTAEAWREAAEKLLVSPPAATPVA